GLVQGDLVRGILLDAEADAGLSPLEDGAAVVRGGGFADLAVLGAAVDRADRGAAIGGGGGGAGQRGSGGRGGGGGGEAARGRAPRRGGRSMQARRPLERRGCKGEGGRRRRRGAGPPACPFAPETRAPRACIGVSRTPIRLIAPDFLGEFAQEDGKDGKISWG